MQPLIDRKREQLGDLCRHCRVRRLALFGSALREDFAPERSDLDFLVEFQSLPVGTYAKTYFGLLESLEQLFGRPVDLVEAGSVRNPYIRREIEGQQETLYAT